MKLCEMCGSEDVGGDKETMCAACEELAMEAGRKAARKRARAKANRLAREDALRSIGMVKVRGSMGGMYWE